MNNIQYFKSAWGDIKNSPGWFGKLCLLALISLIPIFGQIVVFGYLYGWAREIAWGTHEPMPERVFANEDGKLYRRGWFILVLTFVAALVPSIIMQIGGGMQGVGVFGLANGSHAAANSAMAGLGALVNLVGIAAGIFLAVMAWVGSMRISIYDRLSAGFQIDKNWKMMRHDTGGIARIFGMDLLVGLIIGFILSIIISILMVLVVLAGVAGMAASGYHFGNMQNMSDYQAIAMIVQIFGSAGIVGFLGLLVVTFLVCLGTAFVDTLVARAMGYWTMQFNVPQWRGQDEPMPFESAPATAAAQPWQTPQDPSHAQPGVYNQNAPQQPTAYGQPANQATQQPYGQPVYPAAVPYGGTAQQPAAQTWAPPAATADAQAWESPAAPLADAQTAPQPTEPVVAPTAEPAAEPDISPIAEPVAEPVAEPAAEPTAGPATALDAEPKASAEEESVFEQGAKLAADSFESVGFEPDAEQLADAAADEASQDSPQQ